MKITCRAVFNVLKTRTSLLVFIFTFIIIFALFVFLPIWTTPGGSLKTQLSILKFDVYALMFVLSLLNALVISMQYHLRKKHSQQIDTKQIGTLIGTLGASLFATLGCAACYSSILSVFGLGAVIFVGTYRWWIAGVTIIISLIAVFYSGRKIEGVCKRCNSIFK
ncbi:MAG: hypothetical protein ABIH21_03100 [Patescibacteria group bacterium]